MDYTKIIFGAIWASIKEPVSGLSFWIALLCLWSYIGRDAYDWVTYTRPMEACADAAKANLQRVATCPVAGSIVTIYADNSGSFRK